MLTLPESTPRGTLPPGIYRASLTEALARFGHGSAAREQQGALLRLIVTRAARYETIKRILVWGSWPTAKPEPGDLDYSLIVDPRHSRAMIADEDERYFVPAAARLRYGTHLSTLVIKEWPLADYLAFMRLICFDRDRNPRGVLEVYPHEEDEDRE
jgi:hypothetical protein